MPAAFHLQRRHALLNAGKRRAEPALFRASGQGNDKREDKIILNTPKPLIDSHGRKITYLRVSITDRCNLRCVYCMPEKGINPLSHSEIISYEDILRFVNVLANHGVNKIRITGGEPLVRKGLVDFTRNLGKITGITDISMTTNGTLLEKYAAELYNAGLKRINISLDSLKEDRFRQISRMGNLKDVLMGIKLAQKTGFNPIKINTVLIKGINDDEIIDFVNFAREFEINLRFIEYMPIGGNITETITSKWIEEKIRSVFDGFELISGNGYQAVSKEYGFKDSNAVIGFISPLSEHFCTGCNRLRLTASGKLRLCLFYDSEYDIKEILSVGRDDEAIFNWVAGLIQLKQDKHNFSEKAKKPGSLLWANDFMNGIGG
ncbi:MAG: GTP 3',8-cyclase MoaA [Candidatus Acidulodesulfobacterium ferriphilum]|uniref:GTP 3',8-cyclase n=1 Tax=Candidatus Acidulodesulfobacterium ferriphilum TaxID=2597223 RepID=A0A519BDS4_9DELT|nr:MAG: GTP 3',8-cyclase MoaA [Candidatus Acidulodesulfobacterium ferriphilum]